MYYMYGHFTSPAGQHGLDVIGFCCNQCLRVTLASTCIVIGELNAVVLIAITQRCNIVSFCHCGRDD